MTALETILAGILASLAAGMVALIIAALWRRNVKPFDDDWWQP